MRRPTAPVQGQAAMWKKPPHPRGVTSYNRSGALNRVSFRFYITAVRTVQAGNGE